MNTTAEHTTITIEPLTDEEVLAIMHKHNIYRKDKQDFDKRWAKIPKEHVPTDEEKVLIEMHQGKLMSDEKFLLELRKIVPAQYSVVSTRQVAAIYNLRVEYERLPKLKNGKRPVYTGVSVRMQVRSKKRKATNGLRPLTDEEQMAIFGKVHERVHYFKLEDVLRRNLGRWPGAHRFPPKKKLSRGRPKAEEVLAQTFDAE